MTAKGANTVITGRDTCLLDGREYRAVPARRGCDGCAAMPVREIAGDADFGLRNPVQSAAMLVRILNA